MNTPAVALHTDTRRDGLRLGSLAALFTGPIVWILQLYASYVLASQACYPGAERRLTLPAHLAWTRAAIAGVMVVACTVSLLALASSLRAHRRSRAEMRLDLGEAIATTAQRTSFLSLWAIIFSAGAAVGSIMTLLAFFVLPPCAG